MCSYIKLWREYKQKEESENPRSSHIHYLLGQSPYGKRTSKLLVKSKSFGIQYYYKWTVTYTCTIIRGLYHYT